MSERMNLILNTPDQFDRAVHGDDKVPALPSHDDLTIITKDAGMQSGRAVAVITRQIWEALAVLVIAVVVALVLSRIYSAPAEVRAVLPGRVRTTGQRSESQ